MPDKLHLETLIDYMGKMEDERNPIKFIRLWLILIVGALIAIGEALITFNHNYLELHRED